ncbi:MAG: hypothetical protein E5V21_28420 [Mesorhizobium sp.]|nr:MAG: hypothetical protein E5V21_28420 [Mesorhizobium sp.]
MLGQIRPGLRPCRNGGQAHQAACPTFLGIGTQAFKEIGLALPGENGDRRTAPDAVPTVAAAAIRERLP